MSERRLTREAFDRLQWRMSMAQVEELLGWPGQRERPPLFPAPAWERPAPAEEWFWTDGEVAILVVFDGEAGTMEAKAWAGPLPPGADTFCQAVW